MPKAISSMTASFSAAGSSSTPSPGESRALAINGGYYGADAVRKEEDTAYVFGKIVPSSYRLTEAGEPMEADSDYAALEAEDKALVAYAVYAVGETAFSLAPAENGIVYDRAGCRSGYGFCGDRIPQPVHPTQTRRRRSVHIIMPPRPMTGM